MMTIYIALMLSCTGSIKDPNISCDYGASEEVFRDKATCESMAPKMYKRPVRCIDVDVEMKENVKVRLK